MKNSRVLPLDPIELKSQPHNHRALAWSSDAELAVAADDCVTIYLPDFPFLDPEQPFPLDDDDDDDDDKNADQPSGGAGESPPSVSQPAGENGVGILPANLPANDEGDDDLGSGDDGDDEDGVDEDTFDGMLNLQHGRAEDKQQPRRRPQKRQYGDETARVLWVSYPPLNPELNLHVWEAAGKVMPLIRSEVLGGAAPGDEGRSSVEEGAAAGAGAPVEGESEGHAGVEGPVKKEKEQETATATLPVHEATAHPGAGTGIIGGAGASLNHVVAVEWSPSGLGRNLRPVLAVLTGCGSLAVYGEGGALPFGSGARPSRLVGRGKAAVRDLQSWLVLWAVGENFVVPGQEEFGYGEFVKAFAWSREVGAGKALLSYMNDQREIVILCVGTAFQKTAEGLEEAVWNVQEVARMETGGPHGQADACDPDYVPYGSSYCLRWSPWSKEDETWSCLLSYMDRSYVGFKKVTINALAWSPREAPNLVCESKDWDGRCVHLGTDAFLDFEDTIWSINGKLICRGVIATPLHAEPFEVDLSTPTGAKPAHPTARCKTTVPSQSVNNPITGLIIHPVASDTTAPPLTPLYTAVRLSATATNPEWHESNNPAPPPQWLTDIQALVTRHVLLGQAGREGDPNAEADENGEDGIVRGSDADDIEKSGNSDDDNDDNDSEDDLDPDADFDPWANEGPDVHPHSMRLWGLARSPGGGCTAILATPLLTQRPMRGAWGAHRSRVLFGWRTRVGANGEAASTATVDDDDAAAAVNVDGLTTEALLWEWMYGGGPSVLGLTPPLQELLAPTRAPGPRQLARDEATMALRARVRAIFQPFADAQTCEICGGGGGGGEEGGPVSKLTPVFRNVKGEGRVLDAVCARSHRVAVCGGTGLAIMAPGISRACAVCQSRCLEAGYLLERVLGPAGAGDEVAEFVRRELGRANCARCGGKYLD